MLIIEPDPSATSRYWRYLLEILRSEGFADLTTIPTREVSDVTLRGHDLIVLPRCTLPGRARQALLDHVAAGGRLLALQPDGHLLSALGITQTHHAYRRGVLRIAPDKPAVAGLDPRPVQVPVPAIALETSTGTVLATILDDPDGTGVSPAVLTLNHGAGRVTIVSFNLAHAVAWLRQGDPALADVCSSGLDGVFRPSELFAGWLDPARIGVPQADILSALLARLIEELSPQPRLWYYPAAEQRSVVIMTSDDDWSTPEEFDALIQALDARNAKATFFIVPHTRLDSGRIDRWSAQGHAFSVHPALESDLTSYRDTAEPQPAFMRSMLAENVARHRTEHGVTVDTIRQHCVRWLGYVEAARCLEALGVGIDLNYVSVYPFSAGFMAGSGRPLRFVDEAGAIVDVFQQPTIWTEEALIHPEFVFSLKWPVERAVAFVCGLLDENAERWYTPYAINSHPVSFATYSRPLIEALLDRAVALGVPIVSADRWHAFTRARDAVTLHSHFDGQETILELDVPQHLERLSLLLPLLQAEGLPTLRVDPGDTVHGRAAPVNRWGRAYLGIDLDGPISGVIRVVIRSDVPSLS